MELKEVRKNLIAQHQGLRRLMQQLEDELSKGAGFAPTLKALRDALLAHNAAEEGVLVPILRSIDAWGAVRVQQMLDEHKAEHALIATQLEPTVSVDALRAFIADLREHIAQEERDWLSEKVLHDEIVNVDAD